MNEPIISIKFSHSR